jgi:uncharacterized protein YbcI
VLDIEVLDLLSDADIESGRTGMIAILASTPELRETPSTQKTKAKSA